MTSFVCAALQDQKYQAVSEELEDLSKSNLKVREPWILALPSAALLPREDNRKGPLVCTGSQTVFSLAATPNRHVCSMLFID
jgi:hypothetical protein